MRALRRATVSLRNSMKPSADRMASGMLIQKIQAHGTVSTMMPPASGPTTAEVAQTLAL